MPETERPKPKAAGRLNKLDKRVERASALIASLRESKHALESEVTELKREAATLGVSPGAAAAPSEDTALLHAELAELHKERKNIRAKVKQLLDRIEKIESGP